MEEREDTRDMVRKPCRNREERFEEVKERLAFLRVVNQMQKTEASEEREIGLDISSGGQ